MGNGKVPQFKWYCQCVTYGEELVYLIATASSEVEANEKIHANYAIDYIIDIMTPEQMEAHTHFLRPTSIGVAQFVPWWTSTKGGRKHDRTTATQSVS